MKRLARAALEGIELEYEVRGAGEPVVLVRAGLVAEWFQPLLQEQALTDRYRVVSYHRVGYACQPTVPCWSGPFRVRSSRPWLTRRHFSARTNRRWNSGRSRARMPVAFRNRSWRSSEVWSASFLEELSSCALNAHTLHRIPAAPPTDHRQELPLSRVFRRQLAPWDNSLVSHRGKLAPTEPL
jgi:hypothetical protein